MTYKPPILTTPRRPYESVSMSGQACPFDRTSVSALLRLMLNCHSHLEQDDRVAAAIDVCGKLSSDDWRRDACIVRTAAHYIADEADNQYTDRLFRRLGEFLVHVQGG